MTARIIVGNALGVLAGMADESVHCCITSPPYWGLRSYGGDPGMIGLEPTFDEHLDNLIAVFREVRRVLRKDGTCWVNYGDAYASKPSGTNLKTLGQVWDGGKPWRDKRKADTTGNGLKPKDLMEMPSDVARALRDDGWWLRSRIPQIKCLSGGTWLYAKTQKGIGVRMLRDLARLDPSTVHLWNGQRWARVVAWQPSPRPKRPLEIVLRSGERIGCTPEHRWPTERGLVAARDLSAGDVLIRAWLPDGLPVPPWLTKDALWFAGLYLAEGSMSGDTIQISGHARETARWERIQRLCEHYGAMPRRYVDGNSADIHIDASAALRAVLSTALAGRTAKDKRLSGTVWAWDNAALREIVEGYLEGDGGLKRPGRWSIGFTRNYGLERDLRALAARLGVQASIRLAVANIGEREYPSFRGLWYADRSDKWNENAVVEVRHSRARHFYDVAVADKPHLFALASGVLTHNSNPMPESAKDRPTNAVEYWFLLTKAARYFYDAEAVKEPVSGTGHARAAKNYKTPDGWDTGPGAHGTIHRKGREKGKTPGVTPKSAAPGSGIRQNESYQAAMVDQPATRNMRNWVMAATAPFRGAHFATFAPHVIEPWIKAGSSERGCCPGCGAPWVRIIKTCLVPTKSWTPNYRGTDRTRASEGEDAGSNRARDGHIPGGRNESTTTGWRPSCDCDAGDPVPATILDPFAGSGTVGLVADRLGRHSILIEINADYAEMARNRIREDAPLLNEAANG